MNPRRSFLNPIRIGVLLAVAIVVALAGWVRWLEKPATPRWVDHREGKGSILALTAGTHPTGVEVIVAAGYHRSDSPGRDLRMVCYNAADGAVLWETRPDGVLPNGGPPAALAMDTDGNVLAGWKYWSVGRGEHTVVTKLAGSNGALLWEWKAPAAGGQSGHLAAAYPDAGGHVWVAGIHEVAGGVYRRFLALLDTRDGTTRWQRPSSPARDANDDPAVVSPLAGGDALVVTPARHAEGSAPWSIQRIAQVGGATVWEHIFARNSDGNMPYVSWQLDERRKQLVVLTSETLGGRGLRNVRAYDLLTGAERWRASDFGPEELAGGITAASLAGNGDVIVWSRHAREKITRHWFRWSRDDGIWFPETTVTRPEQPMRIILSAQNGSLLNHDLIGRKDERLERIELPATGAGEGVILFRSMGRKKQVEPWRAVRVTDGGRLIRRAFVRRPGGPAAGLQFPDHAVVTPHGRIAIAGDPSRTEPAWWLTVW